LTAVTIGTVSAATPAEKKQDSRLTALESSVKKIQTRLTALESSVAKILTRLTTVENKLKKVQTPPYNAVFGKFQESFPNIQNNVALNMTVDIPVDSNAYLSASGFASNAVEPYLQVDDGMIPDWAYMVQPGGFTISRVVHLNKGKHTINLHITGSNPPDIYGVTMSAVVSEQGNLDCGNNLFCTPQ
jgi:hypothetical protein